MFRRISAVFGRHVLHVFQLADSFWLARDTAHTETVVMVAVVTRTDTAGFYEHDVGAEAGVHGR